MEGFLIFLCISTFEHAKLNCQKTLVFWVDAPWTLLVVYQYFGGTCYLHLQSWESNLKSHHRENLKCCICLFFLVSCREWAFTTRLQRMTHVVNKPLLQSALLLRSPTGRAAAWLATHRKLNQSRYVWRSFTTCIDGRCYGPAMYHTQKK